MQKLFNAAALEGGYYNTAALEGGAYNTAALVGGSDLYDDAAVIGGFALATLATKDTAPTASELAAFGHQTLASLPPTVRDTIAKMFDPKTDKQKVEIYSALALLYLLDSLKAISIAPEIDIQARNMARQRWVIVQNFLQNSVTDDIRHVYARLLRYIHIPHQCPRATKAMRNRWLAAINNRTRPWGRSKAFHALPPGLSTKKYTGLSWTTPSDAIPSVRPIKAKGGKKRSTKRKTAAKPPAKKPRPGAYDSVWVGDDPEPGGDPLWT